jgi:hypothetical protein
MEALTHEKRNKKKHGGSIAKLQGIARPEGSRPQLNAASFLSLFPVFCHDILAITAADAPYLICWTVP